MRSTEHVTAKRAASLVLVLAFVLVGCGDDDGGDSGATTSVAASKGGAPVQLDGEVTNKGSSDVSDQGEAATVEVEVDDDYFEPTFIEAAPGAVVTVELTNEGSRPHTFTLDDGSVDQEVAPGESATVEVTVPMSGPLAFACRFHGSGGMRGAIYSGDGSAPSSAGSTATSGSSSGY